MVPGPSIVRYATVRRSREAAVLSEGERKAMFQGPNANVDSWKYQRTSLNCAPTTKPAPAARTHNVPNPWRERSQPGEFRDPRLQRIQRPDTRLETGESQP